MKKIFSGFIAGAIITLSITSYAAVKLIANYSNNILAIDGKYINTKLVNVVDGKVSRNYVDINAIAKYIGAIKQNGKAISITRPTPKPTPTPEPTPELTPSPMSLEDVVAKTKDSCVMIRVYKNGVSVGTGSGFLYKGYVITAKHVLDIGDKYRIYADDDSYGIWGTKKEVDTFLDVSILTVSDYIPSVKLGDSDNLIEGKKLVSITSPHGYKNSIDECMYSGRKLESGGENLHISGSDMAPGSSGGSIFDYNGELIGMDIAGEGSSNSAIPVNDLKPILEQLN